jgi:hypothetical protein
MGYNAAGVTHVRRFGSHDYSQTVDWLNETSPVNDAMKWQKCLKAKAENKSHQNKMTYIFILNPIMSQWYDFSKFRRKI